MKRSFRSPGHSRAAVKIGIFRSQLPSSTCIFRNNAGFVSQIFYLVLLLFITGCSSATSPSAPGLQNSITDNAIPIISLSELPGGFTATGLLGAWEFNPGKDGLSGELVPLRTPSLGQSYIVNGGSFFTITPCATCLKIKGLAFDYPFIRADFQVSHPFEKGDITKPPTGKNRLDLDIFDPILIVLPLEEPPTEPHLIDIDIFSDSCAFADGYTRELTNVTGTDFACPYYLVVDDSDTMTSTYNRLEMGTKNREFSGWFKGERFQLYLTFGYGVSTRNYLDRLNPIYYNPEFNRKAAWKVNVIPPPEGWPDGNYTEKRDVIVEVYDWQVGATVDASMNDPSDVFCSSEVAGVGIEIIGMTNTLQIQTVPDGSHTGYPDDPLIYKVSIANENMLPGGYYTGYVKVLDVRIPPQVPTVGQVDSLIDVPDGVALDFVSMPEFATYQVFTAEVWSNEPPCADLDVSDYFVDSGRTIQLWPGPATDDPDGVIVRYEYDFDYQGGIFYPEASNTNGEPVTSPVFRNDRFGESKRKVAMRVTDNGYPQKADVSEVIITIFPVSYKRWARTWGANVADRITVDNLGNVFTEGIFHGEVDFDPGPGEEIHSPDNGYYNLYISKFTENGDFVWVRTLGSFDGNEEIQDIDCDSDGNLYLVGFFHTEMDFDPGPGEEIITPYTEHDYFLMKLNADGIFSWVKTWGGAIGYNSIYPYLNHDGLDNFLVSGLFSGTVDFDPSQEVEIRTAPYRALFFSKFDMEGNHISIQIIGNFGDNSGIGCRELFIDENDNIFMTGGFHGTVNFDPDWEPQFWRTGEILRSFYLAKYTPQFEPLWIDTFRAEGTNQNTGRDIAVKGESVYLLSRISGGADLDPGPDVDWKETQYPVPDFAISKFDYDGNYIWGHRIACGGSSGATGCVVNSLEEVFITGEFEETVDFDPGPGTDFQTATDLYNTFITKIDSDGSNLGTRIFRGSQNGSWGIAINNNDVVFLSGELTQTVDFDPSSYGTDFQTVNGRCAYLSRIN